VVTLRAFQALLGGLALIVLLVALVRGVLTRLLPEWAGPPGSLRPGALLVELGSTFLASAAGGYLTAWMGAANPLGHVLVLGIVVLGLGALSALETGARAPVGYQLALLAIAPAGVLAGGLARLRILGVL
jgi:hypothetical protein